MKLTIRSRPAVLLTATIVLITTAGCTVTPTVKYGVINNGSDGLAAPDYEGLIRFNLSRTVVVVDEVATEGQENLSMLKMTAVPVEFPDPIFTITAADSLGVKTHLEVTKRDNTELIESIGSTIEDNRVQLIEEVGGLIATTVPSSRTATLGEESLGIQKYPTVIDTFYDVFLEKPGRGGEKLFSKKTPSGFEYDVVVGPVAADAIAREDFVQHISSGTVNIFFYAACRDITITPASHKGPPFKLRVSDPSFIQTVRFPAKGKVTMHSSCGANVTSEQAETASTAKVLGTLITQAKSLVSESESEGGASEQ